MIVVQHNVQLSVDADDLDFELELLHLDTSTCD